MSLSTYFQYYFVFIICFRNNELNLNVRKRAIRDQIEIESKKIKLMTEEDTEYFNTESTGVNSTK